MRLGTTRRDTKESSTWKDHGREIPRPQKKQIQDPYLESRIVEVMPGYQKMHEGPNSKIATCLVRYLDQHQEGKAKIKSTVCVHEGVDTYRHTNVTALHALLCNQGSEMATSFVTTSHQSTLHPLQ